MNKWFYRAVGTVGVASGFLVLAGGVAQADEADVTQPAVDPQQLRGLLDPFLTPTGGALPDASPGTDGAVDGWAAGGPTDIFGHDFLPKALPTNLHGLPLAPVSTAYAERQASGDLASASLAGQVPHDSVTFRGTATPVSVATALPSVATGTALPSAAGGAHASSGGHASGGTAASHHANGGAGSHGAGPADAATLPAADPANPPYGAIGGLPVADALPIGGVEPADGVELFDMLPLQAAETMTPVHAIPALPAGDPAVPPVPGVAELPPGQPGDARASYTLPSDLPAPLPPLVNAVPTSVGVPAVRTLPLDATSPLDTISPLNLTSPLAQSPSPGSAPSWGPTSPVSAANRLPAAHHHIATTGVKDLAPSAVPAQHVGQLTQPANAGRHAAPRGGRHAAKPGRHAAHTNRGAGPGRRVMSSLAGRAAERPVSGEDFDFR